MGVPDRPRVCTRRPPHTAAQSGRLERGCPGPSATPSTLRSARLSPNKLPQRLDGDGAPWRLVLNPATLEEPQCDHQAPLLSAPSQQRSGAAV